MERNSVVLKTYNQSNIEQLAMCTVRLRHQIVICRFFVLLGDGPSLLGMPDIQLLDILKMMCEVVEYQQADRKLNSQTIQPYDGLGCKVNMDQQIKTDNADVNAAN